MIRKSVIKRRKEAQLRQVERDKRTPKQQLARLNKLLGRNVGAVKERKILKQLIKQNAN